jgi:septal ring factor EnvC (AmiA/AmiB activator)
LQEREKYNKMVEKMQRDIMEANQNVTEEATQRQRLQMELDSKDSEIEQLRQKLSMFNTDSASVNSSSLEDSVVEDQNVSGKWSHASQKILFGNNNEFTKNKNKIL